MNDNGLSAADVALLAGNNNSGWGGNGWESMMWIFALLVLANGFGGFGWGGNRGEGGGNSPAIQGALTRGDLCMDMNFQEVKREIQNANDAVNLGFSNLNSTICNQQYDTARMINGLQSTVQGGFNSTNVALLQGQNALSSQLAQCCCNLETGITGVNYNISTQACDTRAQIQASTQAIIDKLSAQEMEAKNAQIAALNQQLFAAQLQASQSAQNQYLVNTLRPTAIPAYITCSPYTSAYGIGLTSGCGCSQNSCCGSFNM